MIHRTLLLCLLTAGSVGAPATAAPANPAPVMPQGTWIWDDGRAGVEFHACGQALCGRIVWLKADGQLDAKNPDTALRRHRVCGIDYITDVKSTGSGKWKGGRVYDFNSGSSYDLDIDAIEPARVIMRGYKGIRLLGATLTLVRPKTELPRCAPANGS